jgi:curved DNA-binding protein CbpA
MDFYAILGIPRDADDLAIRSAYKALARQYHPDAGSGADSARFRAVAEAYETLVDPARRQGYDLSLRRPERIMPVMPVRVEPLAGRRTSPEDRFSDLFAGLMRSFEADLIFFFRRRR